MPVGKKYEKLYTLDMNSGWEMAAGSSPRSAICRSIHRAIRYMRANIDRPISLDEIARAACCSPSKLQRAFRRQFAASPITMLRRFRIDAAKDRLASGDYSTVMDVTTSLGISNSGRFAAEFRKQTGRLPSELIRPEQNAPDIPVAAEAASDATA
jgi:transcriptional regulator GlxA family with amidase domain